MMSIRLADKARVQSRAAADLSRLAAGLYVGVTAVPQPDGTLLASQINVFPEIGDRSLLVPSAHIVVYASRQADGSLAAERVSVGKNGMVPAS